MKELMIFALTVAGMLSYWYGFKNLTLIFAVAMLFLINHWVLALILLLIAAKKAWNEYGYSFFSSIKSCPGCHECDPEAYPN